MAKKANTPKSIAETEAAAKADKKVKAPAKATPAKAVTKQTSTKPATVTLNPVEPYTLFTDFDISLFKSGKHYKLYEKLGAQVVTYKGIVGTYFAVWAPNAQYVSVIANFNGWERGSH